MSLTGMPLLGTAWKVAKGRLGIARVPLAVNLSLTYRCNLRCTYCEVWSEPPAEMETAAVLRLLDEMAAAGTERVSLVGGEPMLRKDIGVIVARAKARGMTVNLVSNGLRIPQRIAELSGVDFVVISLDGPVDVHDAARGQGAHRQALAAIRAARAAGIEVWTTTVLTRHNVARLDELLALARAEGVHATFLPVMGQALRSRNADDLAPDGPEFAAAIDQLLAEAGRSGSPVAVSKGLLRFYREHWGRPAAAPRRGAWHAGVLPCQAGRLFCSITPNGRLAPCYYLQAPNQGPSATGMGFAEALRRLPLPDCAGCWCDSFIEVNLVFQLHPGTIVHVLRQLARTS